MEQLVQEICLTPCTSINIISRFMMQIERAAQTVKDREIAQQLDLQISAIAGISQVVVAVCSLLCLFIILSFF